MQLAGDVSINGHYWRRRSEFYIWPELRMSRTFKFWEMCVSLHYINVTLHYCKQHNHCLFFYLAMTSWFDNVNVIWYRYPCHPWYAHHMSWVYDRINIVVSISNINESVGPGDASYTYVDGGGHACPGTVHGHDNDNSLVFNRQRSCQIFQYQLYSIYMNIWIYSIHIWST